MKMHKPLCMAGVLGVLVCCGTTCPTTTTPGTSSGPSNTSTTGVTGLNTAAQILANSAVSNVRRQLESALGRPIIPHGDSLLSPPNIEGSFGIAGERLVPASIPLAVGTLRWSNQTSDNHINTDYTQFLGGGLEQIGVSRRGEIIRGSGSDFTVYSILEATIGNCIVTGILIMKGSQDSAGNIEGEYLSVVLDDMGACSAIDTAGTFEFTRR